MEQKYITLNNGLQIPQFGLGVYQIPGDEATKETCLTALKMGYRHIDTAHAYQNERGVGQAVKESGIPRENIWITSKLWPSDYGKGITAIAIDKMLGRLQTGYIDLLLLHQQFGDYRGAWRDMEKAIAAGKVQSIGFRFRKSTPPCCRWNAIPITSRNRSKRELRPMALSSRAGIRWVTAIKRCSRNRCSRKSLQNTVRPMRKSSCAGIFRKGTSSSRDR